MGSEVESIKTQQEEFQAFQVSHIEPLAHQVEDCNRLGQGLIQSAAGGVNTANLEKDLEKMNDKWNDLKDRVSITHLAYTFSLQKIVTTCTHSIKSDKVESL